jgi:hypothetical protein
LLDAMGNSMGIKPAMIGISCGYGDMFYMGYTMLYNRFDAMLVLIKTLLILCYQ